MDKRIISKKELENVKSLFNQLYKKDDTNSNSKINIKDTISISRLYK